MRGGVGQRCLSVWSTCREDGICENKLIMLILSDGQKDVYTSVIVKSIGCHKRYPQRHAKYTFE